MADRIFTGANGRKYINNEPRLHPPQRKPLTEEEMRMLGGAAFGIDITLDGNLMAFGRAIELAHGIDGAPEERNFCPRCGKRTNGIHTCTPPGDCDVHG